MAASAQRWFHGPASDLLLGCGVAYFGAFALLLAAGRELEQSLPIGLLAIGTLLVGGPHYGATLLRVYGRAEERRRYALFAVHASLLIAALFVLGLYLPLLGSALLTLYLTWSPWHYAGQNYGIAVAFLRRRGIAISAPAARALQASFWLSFGLTFLAVHRAGSGGGGYAPLSATGEQIAFLPLGIPPALALPAGVLLLAAYLACLGVAAADLARRASLRALAPTALLVASQGLWFTVPVVVRAGAWLPDRLPFATGSMEYAFLFVMFAHSAQYLWITSYYARAERGEPIGQHLLWAFLLGSAIWGLPALVFAPRALGPRPYDAGLFLMIAAAVNLHHFVLDGAIWKLREGPIARILLREAPAPEAARPRPRSRLAPVLVAATGVLCAGIFLVDKLEREFGVRRALARGDAARVERAAGRLRAIGRESAAPALNAGLLRVQRGELEQARRDIEASLAVRPTATGWTALGQLEARAGNLDTAIRALEAALALDPDQPTALHQAGQVYLERGEPARAIPYLERARGLAAGTSTRQIERALARARREASATGSRPL